MSTIFLSRYYDGNFEVFQRNIKKGLLLENQLQQKKERIIHYLEKDLLQIDSNDLLCEFIRNTKIEFSPDIKTSPYGITKQYIIDLLKKTKNKPHPANCPLNGLIDELISDLNAMSDEEFENSKKRYDIRSTHGIQAHRNSCQECGEKNSERFCDEVYRIVEGMIWGGLHYNKIVEGEYCFETNTIILYLNAIKNNHSDDCIESVFARELFHAYHMKSVELAGGKWLNKRKYQGNVVLESLAASFEYYYTKNVMENSAMCEENLRYWNRYSVDFWPYSGAKGIVKMNEIKEAADISRLKMAQSFTLVFTDSLEKTEDSAYEDIMASLKYIDETPIGKLESIRKKYKEKQKTLIKKTSTVDIDGYVDFLQSQGLTKNGVNTRKRNLLDAETLLPFDIDMAVMNDKLMYLALKLLCAVDNPAHAQRQNALRYYYRFKRGIDYPRLREAENLFNNTSSYKILGARIESSARNIEINDFLRGNQIVEQYHIEAELEIEDEGEKVFLLGVCTYNPGYRVTFSVTKESLLSFSENEGKMPQREYEEKFNELSGEGIKDIFPGADAKERYSDLWSLIVEMFNSQARKDHKNNCKVIMEYGQFWQIKYDLDREKRKAESLRREEEFIRKHEDELKKKYKSDNK